MDVIFIELECPQELLIAVRVREEGYMNSYSLMEPEYASTEIDRILSAYEDGQLEQLVLIPKAIADDFDYNRKYKKRFCAAYVHKQKSKI